MPKQSSLFTFIQQCIADNTIASLPMGSRHKLINGNSTSPAYLLFATQHVNLENPFSKRAFEIAKEPGHLRVDSFFSGSLDNRSLSYCHGTEYFVKGRDQIIVHYYFDVWGYLTQITCKLGNSIIRASREEMEILIKRATAYSDAITTLLNKKQEKFLKISKDIEDATNIILEPQKATKRDLQYLKNILESRAHLVQQKSSLCDEIITDNILFTAYLEKIISREQEKEAEDLYESEEETEPTPTIYVATAQAKPTKKKKIDLTGQLKVKLKNLTKISNQLSDNSSVAELTQYLQQLTETRLEILCLEGDLDLIKQLDQTKSELGLFVSALKNGNLEHIKVVFPYCSNQINIEIYHTAVFTWIIEAKDKPHIFEKKLKVFDYLHANCNMFNIFIRIRSSSCFESDNIYYSILYLAYLTNNHKLFSALLKYGANPHNFWKMDKNGKYKKPMQALLEQPINTGFYVEELVRYGLTVQTSIKKKIIPLSEVPRYKNSIPLSQYRALLAVAQEMRTYSHRPRIIDVPKNLRDASGETIFDCPLLEYVYTYNIYTGQTGELFKALVNNSSLDSLLIALPYVAENPGITPIWLTNSLKSRLYYAMPGRDYERKNNEVYGIEIEGDHNNLSLIFNLQGEECEDFIRTRLVIDAINRKFATLTAEDIEETEYKICSLIGKIKSINIPLLINELYTALNILAVARGSLSEQQQANLIDNFAQIGILLLEHAEKIWRLAEQEIRNGIVSGNRVPLDRIEDLKTERHKRYDNAINNFNRAIQAAYFNKYPNLCKMPVVDKCFEEATKLLTDPLKLSASIKLYWAQNFRTRQEWEMLRITNKFKLLY